MPHVPFWTLPTSGLRTLAQAPEICETDKTWQAGTGVAPMAEISAVYGSEAAWSIVATALFLAGHSMKARPFQGNVVGTRCLRSPPRADSGVLLSTCHCSPSWRP